MSTRAAYRAGIEVPAIICTNFWCSRSPRQCPDLAAVSEFNKHKVYAPYLIGLLWANQGLALTHRQALLSVDPAGAFNIDRLAVVAELLAQHAGAETNRPAGLAFSDSRPFKRWASETFISPNLTF